MKLIAAILLLSTQLLPAPVYDGRMIGYVNHIYQAGDNWFVVPLQENTNTLSGIFYGNSIPDGSTVSLWNPTTANFDTSSVFQSGAWTLDMTLLPGIGARLTTSSTFTNTFVGAVLNHDGNVLTNLYAISPPPLFVGSAGVYLFGDAAPMVNTGTDVFLNILGRLPVAGEQVTLLDAFSQTLTTSTYLGDNAWDAIPTLSVSQAAFFNIAAVPEPSSVALGLLGVALLGFIGQRRQKSNP